MDTVKILTEISKRLRELYKNYPERTNSIFRRSYDRELCAKGIIVEADMLKIYVNATGLKYYEDDDILDVKRFKNISKEYLENNCCIPIRQNETETEMLISDPYTIDLMFYFFIKFYKMKLTFSFARRSIIEKLIQDVYNEDNIETKPTPGDIVLDEDALKSMASETKIVRLVNEMFSRAIESDASDIHVEPKESMYIIRFRIDGILQEFLTGSLTQYPAVASRIKLIGGLNIAENRLPQDGRTNIKLGKQDIDIRISTIPVMNGESIVLRILKNEGTSFNLQSTGMTENIRNSFDNIITLPHGLLLVVGPTGSGKTTTLYSIMTQLNKPGKKIITIEDPVEYRIAGLLQMQVNPKIGLTFAKGLRNIVRQDPDIILVGEIRDKETAEIAINAALTGHLVLSTLHTNDAAGAISRLLDIGIEGFLISSSLICVLSQRLVRKTCKSCAGKALNKNVKCKNCSGTGYKGRTAIHELLIVDDKIRKAIRNSSSSSEINEIAIANGMIPLIEDGNRKVKQGITDEAEIMRTISAGQ